MGVEVLRNTEIRYLLVDHSAIPEEKIDTASLRVLAERTDRYFELIPEGIVAIVAPNDVLFGLSRMWGMLAQQQGLVVQVMRTRGEAIAWLKDELTQRQLPCCLTD